MIFFRKIFSLTLLFFLISGLNSYAEIVNKIKVTGNERISIETIVIFGDIEIGQDLNVENVNQIIKKLYETNFFSNIAIELKNGVLDIFVKENPIVNSIVFKGEKADKYKEAITQMISLREKTSYLKNYVKTDINVIKEFYRELGFYFAKIELDIEELPKNRVDLIYTIEKGEKAKISKIYFMGDKKVREKRLRDIITSQESAFWKFISRNVYLNKKRIELDQRLLERYYKNKGYYDVKISSSNVEYSEGEGFVLTFSIDGGQRYKFKKITLDVSNALDASVFAPLEKSFNKIVGDYYSERDLTKILESIDTLSEQKELQFINHAVTETVDDDGIEVKIRIFEGQKFTIERLDIVGNSVTNDSVIRSEMLIDEGDPYSALLVNKSINRLKARGIFGVVQEKITEGSSPDLKVLEIKVEERATGEISAGAGIGTDGTSFMFMVSENNWLGRGISLNSSVNISEEKVSGNLGVNNPNYKYSGNSVYASLDISAADYMETSGFESQRTGLSFGTEFEQYEDLYLSPSLAFLHESIDVDSTASSAIKKMDGTFTNIDFLYGITQDKRDQPFKTTSGYRTKWTQSLPLLMDQSSLMNGIDISMYKAINEDIIGSVKVYGRTIHGIDEEDVRLTSRLYLPTSKLRGFQARKVGPKDGDDYVGGNYATALGFEAALPNLLPESTRTDISLFMDTANLWHVDYSEDIDDTNKIRSSVGISANIWTTIGPLSFTLAQDLTKATNDKTETFNFRLGTSF